MLAAGVLVGGGRALTTTEVGGGRRLYAQKLLSAEQAADARLVGHLEQEMQKRERLPWFRRRRRPRRVDWSKRKPMPQYQKRGHAFAV